MKASKVTFIFCRQRKTRWKCPIQPSTLTIQNRKAEVKEKKMKRHKQPSRGISLIVATSYNQLPSLSLRRWAQLKIVKQILVRKLHIYSFENIQRRVIILLNFCAIEAASATRLSSVNKGESAVRSPGLLLNSIKYCWMQVNVIPSIFFCIKINTKKRFLSKGWVYALCTMNEMTFRWLFIKMLPLWALSSDWQILSAYLHSDQQQRFINTNLVSTNSGNKLIKGKLKNLEQMFFFLSS